MAEDLSSHSSGAGKASNWISRGNWRETDDLVFPKDLIFVNRSVVGHFGKLSRLRAEAPLARDHPEPMPVG